MINSNDRQQPVDEQVIKAASFLERAPQLMPDQIAPVVADSPELESVAEE